MTKEVEVLLEDKEALNVIRTRFNVKEDRFDKGLVFVQKILDGMSKNKAYVEAFGVSIDKAKTLSSQLHRGKWIQELIKYLRPNEDSLYFGETKRIIGRGMEIINNPKSSNREVTEAIKALQPFIKAEKQRLEVDVSIADNTGDSIVTQLNDKIAMLADAGKMVNEAGEIVDVELIE